MPSDVSGTCIDTGHSRVRRRLTRFANDHVVAIMVGVPVLLLVVLFAYPLFWMLYQSMWVTVPGLEPRIDPLYNYGQVVVSSDFWGSMRRTFVYALGSFSLSFLGGLFFALAINRVRRGWLRTTYLTVLLFVLAIPVSVAALMWGALLAEHEAALLNMVLMDLGVVREPVGYLQTRSWALPIVTFIDGWLRMPLATLVFLAGRRTIPVRLYEAARMDGATTFQTFRHVTLPQLRPYVFTVVLLLWASAFQAFSVVWVLTDGGPVHRTRTVALFVYEVGILYLDFGKGAAISASLAVVSVVVTAVFIRRFLDTG
jgi:multiple sugar transport system permease protein